MMIDNAFVALVLASGGCAVLSVIGWHAGWSWWPVGALAILRVPGVLVTVAVALSFVSGLVARLLRLR